MSDALHLGSDLAGFLVSLFALWLAKRPPSATLTYGYYRAEVVGALISVLIIWLITGILIYEGVQRIINRNYELKPLWMLITAIVGVIFNLVMGTVLHCGIERCKIPHGHSHGSDTEVIIENDVLSSNNNNHDNNNSENENQEPIIVENSKKKNINVNAALIHVIGDFVQSCGVLIASIIILLRPEYKIADPICTFIFSIIVLFTTITVLKDIIVVFMEGSPNRNRIILMERDLRSNSSVLSVHDLHIWALTTTRLVASVHLVVGSEQDYVSVEKFATKLLKEKYGMSKTTVQIDVFNSECDVCRTL
ncbi:DgyrCDS14038 [Dimorphilus gyrociliatus]|nr:DgyrCDS14038 [Dimorphilus gyrociliatus]